MTDANQSDAVVVPEGWIKHDGGPCPVANGSFNHIRFRDGFEHAYWIADNPMWWKHNGDEYDIIAYKPEPGAGGEKG